MRPIPLFSLILIVSLCTLAFAAGGKAHENKVDYIGTGGADAMQKFNADFKGLSAKTAASFLEMEKRSRLDHSLYVRRPANGDFFDRFTRLIQVKIYSATERKCDAPVEAISLEVNGEKKMAESLYAYTWLACAEDQVVVPSRFLDKYIEKYGLYDEKDFDRDQYIYKNVQSRWQVRVKPMLTAAKTAALLITVIDELVFNDAYRNARAMLRSSEDKTQNKF